MASFLDIANWQNLGQVQFRKWKVNRMLWCVHRSVMPRVTAMLVRLCLKHRHHRDDDMQLDQFIIASGQHGGTLLIAGHRWSSSRR